MSSFNLPIAHQAPPALGCGTCRACCVIGGVPELGKPFYTDCANLCERGCAIYDERPMRCREFRCAWHLGMLGPRIDRRPDQCGVMFQFDAGPGGEWVLGMYELSPGAADSSKARYLRDIIFSSKQTRHLRFARENTRILRHGDEVKIDYPIANHYLAKRTNT